MGKKRKRKPPPKPVATRSETAKAWLGLGPQRKLDPWEALIGALFGAVIAALIAWLIFDRSAALLVLAVGSILGTVQEFQSRRRE